MADCCSSGTCAGHIPIGRIIEECDRLFNQEKKQALGEHLRFWRRRAAELGDKKGELTMLSEMMGHYRMANDEARGIAAIRDGLALIRELKIENTISAGTIFINAATAFQSFGFSGEAATYYRAAENAYRQNLPPDDIRFAALFNNMASACIDARKFEEAAACYLQAAEILQKAGQLMDLAVTFINLAQFYDGLDPEDPRIEENLDRARACFEDPAAQRDGYYAHTCRKCASVFGYFGRFMEEEELQKRADDFYAGA